MTTCDIGASPRSCRAATVCPATYGGCADGVKTEAPVRQRCDASTLQDARVACSAGPDSATCVAYFQFLTQANAACATCLQPFDVSFTDVAGIFKCISPFVGDRCNIQTGCYVDCEKTSCASCASGQEDQCSSEVRGTQCRNFFQGSSCIVTGFLGQGSFCNPLNYGSNFGAWFQAVGTRYCGR
ncbi:MAG: hypothetical protein U0169_12980 [Polyangiaceae bacterium]